MKRVDYTPLKKYLKTMDKTNREQFANQCETTISYINKRISLEKPFGYRIAKHIYRLGVMQPQQLRPNDWQDFSWNI